ncbi:hypothetical protein DFH08DRAFT_863114 [Mycena albidolilacea]|uniref:Uncharacterized protein n=1 Tax=Mycena albidolilacea TaxID=1033008 RepID=A0AAD7A592_9AGAR|nr:hypothetical protein DFH08DRAFT_863114 [Mycena albidolilacea]
MLFTWISVAAALAPLAAASVLHAAPEARVTVNPQTCVGYEKYIGIHDSTLSYSPACASITEACLKENGTSIWSHQSCVAAATCQGTLSVITLNQCQNPNVLVAGSIPNLSAAIYGNIVGSCASSGCPITQQNFIDFIYGAMSSAGVTQWPSSVDDVLTEWWKPILAWTATGDSIPYTNFNDWLHWSNS